MNRCPRLLGCAVLWLAAAAPAAADAYRIQPVEKAPPSELAEPIRNELQPSAIQLLNEDAPLCEIWLRKELPGGAPGLGLSRSYPQLPDTALIGAMRVTGKMHDNRHNAIPPGVYTLRHGLQPQDGNHVGASEYIDFALLLNAQEDRTVAGEFETPRDMLLQSMFDGGVGHPIVLALLPPSAPSTPSLSLNARDHWVLEAKAGGMVLALVIVGVYEH